jgi:serralysin
MARTVTLTNRDDTFVQGFGANNVNVTVIALGGKDSILLDRDNDLGGGNFVNAGEGDDIVENHREDGSSIFLGLGADQYIGLGFGSFATEAGDAIFGGQGNDRFAFSTFKSTYNGGNDNDIFFSQGQRNIINGGAGIDMVSYRPREGGDGGVTINLQTQRVLTGSIAVEVLSSIENAEGSAQNDDISGNGMANRLLGGDGQDSLFGGAGADSLTGGMGLDGLTGNAGADTFIYTTASHAAVFGDFAEEILDFSRAEGDRIDLRSIDADSGVPGNQSFVFRGTAAFTGDQRQLRFLANGPDQVVIQGDRTGDGVADFQILLDGITTLRATDFLL